MTTLSMGAERPAGPPRRSPRPACFERQGRLSLNAGPAGRPPQRRSTTACLRVESYSIVTQAERVSIGSPWLSFPASKALRVNLYSPAPRG